MRVGLATWGSWGKGCECISRKGRCGVHRRLGWHSASKWRLRHFPMCCFAADVWAADEHLAAHGRARLGSYFYLV